MKWERDWGCLVGLNRLVVGPLLGSVLVAGCCPDPRPTGATVRLVGAPPGGTRGHTGRAAVTVPAARPVPLAYRKCRSKKALASSHS